MKKLVLATVVAIGWSAPVSWGAACCGGGVIFPALISGDQRTQITASVGQSAVVVENVDAEGYWTRSDTTSALRTFRVDAATLLSDRIQAGVSIPVLQRENRLGSYAGLGDVNASLGYEYLPDWDYHPIRPKGIGYLQVTLPTGLSRYESALGGGDSRGQGFFAVGVGTLFTKTFSDWDAFVSGSVQQSFGHRVATPSIAGFLRPSQGVSTGFGLGYNFSSIRIGGGIQWIWEGAVKLGDREIGAAERFATGSLQASYLASDQWAWTALYSDQTWFGSPQNTSLARGVVLQVQRRWMR